MVLRDAGLHTEPALRGGVQRPNRTLRGRARAGGPGHEAVTRIRSEAADVEALRRQVGIEVKGVEMLTSCTPTSDRTRNRSASPLRRRTRRTEGRPPGA